MNSYEINRLWEKKANIILFLLQSGGKKNCIGTRIFSSASVVSVVSDQLMLQVEPPKDRPE